MHYMQRILRIYTDQEKHEQINPHENFSNLSNSTCDFSLSAEGKRKQLIDQLISKAVIQLAACIGVRKEVELAEDSPHDIFPEDRGSKLHGTLL
jgi:hypothetical protein